MSVYPDWIAANAVDAAQLEDEFDIDHGKPRWAETAALPLYFPRLSMGIHLSDGRVLKVQAGNSERRKAIDLLVRTDDQADGHGRAAIDVERKTTGSAYFFEEGCELPVNVPVLSYSAHQSGDYRDAFGDWRYSGKMRTFRRFPAISFFMALRHDLGVALMVPGTSIVDESRWEWIDASGPFAGQIWVARVPRSEAVLCKPTEYTAENLVMAAIGPHL